MSSELVHEVWGLLQLAAAGGVMGLFAHRTFAPGVYARGMPAAIGLFGLYLAPFLVEAGWPWATGPTIAGQPLLPALALTLGITAVLKLVGLGVEGRRL